MKKLFLIVAVMATLCVAAPDLRAEDDHPPPEPSPSVIDAGEVIVPGNAEPADAPVVVPGIDKHDGKILGDSLNEVMNVATNYKALGALGTIAAILALLIALTKLRIVSAFLEVKQLMWLRPVLAVVLGGAGGGVAAAAEGQPVFAGIISGVLAAFTGVGGYEFIRLASPKERDKVRTSRADIEAGAAALGEKAAAAQATANFSIAAVDEKIAAANKLPHSKRLGALADLAAGGSSTSTGVRG